MRKLIPLFWIALVLFVASCEDSKIDSRTQYIKAYENRFEVDTVQTDFQEYELFTDTTLIDFEDELDDRGYRLEKVEKVRFYQFSLSLDEEPLYPVKNLDFVDSIDVYMRSGDLEEVLIAKFTTHPSDPDAPNDSFPPGKRETGIKLIPQYDKDNYDDFQEYIEAGELHFRVRFTAKQRLEHPVTLKFESKFNVDVKRFGI